MKRKLTLFLFACSLFIGNTVPCFAAGTQGSFLAEATIVAKEAPSEVKEEFTFELSSLLPSSAQTKRMQIETVIFN